MVELDHIGFVVNIIDRAIDRFTKVYGYVLESEVLYDPAQKVFLAMLLSTNNYRVELIQPVGETAPSFDFMKQGGGLHHFCYAVKDLETAIEYMRKHEHVLIKRPTPAILMENRNVAFLFSKIDRQIIELVEVKNA